MERGILQSVEPEPTEGYSPVTALILETARCTSSSMASRFTRPEQGRSPIRDISICRPERCCRKWWSTCWKLFFHGGQAFPAVRPVFQQTGAGLGNGVHGGAALDGAHIVGVFSHFRKRHAVKALDQIRHGLHSAGVAEIVEGVAASGADGDLIAQRAHRFPADAADAAVKGGGFLNPVSVGFHNAADAFQIPQTFLAAVKGKEQGFGTLFQGLPGVFQIQQQDGRAGCVVPRAGTADPLLIPGQRHGLRVSGNTVSVWADRRIRFLAAVSCGPKKISRFLAVSTKKGILYSCSRSPINAILPSSWPEGAGMRQRGF